MMPLPEYALLLVDGYAPLTKLSWTLARALL